MMGHLKDLAGSAAEPGIVVFGDTHYARFWDHVAEVFQARPEVINPNDELRHFVSLVTSRYSGVPTVNLGDSIDYLLCDYDCRTMNGVDNRTLFYEEISGVPQYYEILGNHDYRLYPYNLRFWGLGHINLSEAERRRVAQWLGHHGIRSPVTELRAIARVGAKVDPLQGYRGFREPVSRKVGGFNCIFLNTRRDALLTMKGLARAAVGALHGAKADLSAGSGRALWQMSIDSEGLNRQDLDWFGGLARQCGNEPVVVFMHAPLLNPACGALGKTVLLDLDRFEHSRLEHGIGHFVMASGGGALLRIMCSEGWRERNIVVIAGHVHSARYFLIDKETLVARQVSLPELNGRWDSERFIKHLTALPLGVIGTADSARKTGYGRITLAGFEEMVLRSFVGGLPQSTRKTGANAGDEVDRLLERIGERL